MKAFPYQHKNPTSGLTTESEGMTLRDYFAAMALQGLLACDVDCSPESVEIIAKSTYIIADEMLKAREVKND